MVRFDCGIGVFCVDQWASLGALHAVIGAAIAAQMLLERTVSKLLFYFNIRIYR